MYILVKNLRNVMNSAIETWIGASYENGAADIPMRLALTEMEHPQSPTHMQVYNTTAVNFADDELKKNVQNIST